MRFALSSDFRHPAIVAHEAASIQLISGGRFELGVVRQLLVGTPVHHADASYRIDGLDLDVLPMPRPSSPAASG